MSNAPNYLVHRQGLASSAKVFDPSACTKFAHVPLWPLSDNPTGPVFVRYWSNSGHRRILAEDRFRE